MSLRKHANLSELLPAPLTRNRLFLVDGTTEGVDVGDGTAKGDDGTPASPSSPHFQGKMWKSIRPGHLLSWLGPGNRWRLSPSIHISTNM